MHIKMSNKINIGIEKKTLAELEKDTNIKEITNNDDLSLIKDIFATTKNIDIKKAYNWNDEIFVFYDNNEPKYYISEANLVKYYEIKNGEEKEIAEENEVHDIMLKILLLDMYQESTNELKAELEAIKKQKEEELNDETNTIQNDTNELKDEIEITADYLILEINEQLDFYKNIKNKSNRFIRNKPFDWIQYKKTWKKTLIWMRKDAKEYIENLKNKRKLLNKQPELLDLKQIQEDIQRYENQQQNFIADRTSATNQERADTTSPDVNNLEEAEDENKKLKKRAKYMQKYAKQLRETGMRTIDLHQKEDFTAWLKKIVNWDIDEIVKNGVIINPFIAKYPDDYAYLCKTYPRIKEFINYDKKNNWGNKNNHSDWTAQYTPWNSTTNQWNSDIERIVWNTTGDRIMDAYWKKGIGGIVGQLFDEWAKAMHRHNNSREYQQAKNFVSKVWWALLLFWIGKTIFNRAKKGASKIPWVNKLPSWLWAGVLIWSWGILFKGLNKDHSWLLENLVWMSFGNKQSQKHKERLVNFANSWYKSKDVIPQDHTKIQTLIGDIPISALTSYGILWSNLHLNYDNLENYINNGNLTSFEREEKMEAFNYFKDNNDQNLVRTTLKNLWITNTVLNDPSNANRTINELSISVTWDMISTLTKQFESKNMRIAGEEIEYIQNYQRIEDYYIKNHNSQSISQMMLVRETNKRIVPENSQIEQEESQLKLLETAKILKTIDVLGDYSLNEIELYLQTNPVSFDIKKMAEEQPDINKKTELEDKIIELEKLRDAYQKLPEQILAEGLTELWISNSEISTNPNKKVKTYYIERQNNKEKENRAEKRIQILENYENTNYLTHDPNNTDIQNLLNDDTLTTKEDIYDAIEQLDKQNPNTIFQFDYTKDPYLRLNLNFPISQSTKDNIDDLTTPLSTKEIWIMRWIMEITNQNLSQANQNPKANFKFIQTGSDISVESYWHKTKIDISKKQIINFPVGSNSTNAIVFSSISELLLTTLDISVTVNSFAGTSTLDEPFNKPRRSKEVQFADKSRLEKLRELTDTEILDLFKWKTKLEIAGMLATTAIWARWGMRIWSLLFRNKALFNTILWATWAIWGAYWLNKIFFDENIIDWLYNMWKWIINWNLSQQNTDISTNTISSHKNEYTEYLNSLKLNGKSIRKQ